MAQSAPVGWADSGGVPYGSLATGLDVPWGAIPVNCLGIADADDISEVGSEPLPCRAGAPRLAAAS